MQVGLLGLQGAFLDHIPHLQQCGVSHTVVRTQADLAAIDRLIIPGGESTVMAKFLGEFAMTAPLKACIEAGMPVWGICAGAILLAQKVDGRPGALAALPMAVTRNAYGRQIASDTHLLDVPLLSLYEYPAIFIRSPRIDQWDADAVTVHARRDPDPVFVQKGHIMATTFHPELNPDIAFHRYFIDL
ncbi:MAG: pyridoxal 5'-phosphate synthase glutaminase subunit PdxT [Desulfatitalea sp.]|nr:pyridoxal 5'-phosphate synthase glutaminase subunit PdxT [Desulfatitalea sp.]NNK02589.1 pyridoxal 5'-phosphate synthase glutaminase subunit PdxT [Desulfatitalea sp.]